MKHIHTFGYFENEETLNKLPNKRRDCVIRAISIASDKKTYEDVLHDLTKLTVKYSEKNNSVGRMIKENFEKATDILNYGVYKNVYHNYILSLGFEWVPTMNIGSGCKVHLKRSELPSGTLICQVSLHLTVVQDGFIFDDHDPSRNETRCVYGYYKKIC
jgi:hypothetical protein